jgi:putative ABC transport system permease protein
MCAGWCWLESDERRSSEAGLALGLGHLAQAMLFGVEGNSAAIIGAAALVVVVVALAAGAVPARRATTVNPIEELRIE